MAKIDRRGEHHAQPACALAVMRGRPAHDKLRAFQLEVDGITSHFPLLGPRLKRRVKFAQTSSRSWPVSPWEAG